LIVACQSKTPSPPAPAQTDPSGEAAPPDFGLTPDPSERELFQYRGLLFGMTDATTWQSSSIMWLDLDTWEVSEVLAGASGDPFLTYSGSQGILFNRTEASFNIQTFDSSLNFGGQQALALDHVGDPYAALQISATEWLLSLHSEGAIALYDLATASVTKKWTAVDFGLPADTTLKPTEIYFAMVDDRFIAIIANQGYVRQDWNMVPTQNAALLGRYSAL
jgi:hypothetical protein